MAIILETIKSAAFRKTITIAAGDTFSVLNNAVEDTDFRLEAPVDADVVLSITIQAIARS